MRVSYQERDDAAAGLRALARSVERGQGNPGSGGVAITARLILGLEDVHWGPEELRRLADLIDGGEFGEVAGDGEGK